MGRNRQGTTGGLIVIGMLALAPTLGAQLDSDNFEDYAVGSTIAGQGAWDTWDQVAGVDAVVTDLYNSTLPSAMYPNPTKSLELEGADDIVRLFDGLNAGVFEYTSNVYIPSGQAGNYFFILLNEYEHGGPKNWSAQIVMSDGGAFGIPAGQVGDLGGSTAATPGSILPTTPIVYDTWVEIRVVIDIANNSYDAYYNNVQITAGNVWRGSPLGPGQQLELRCLDLYNDSATGSGNNFYYDDVLVDIPGGCGTCCPFDTFTCLSDCLGDQVLLDWSTFQTGGYTGGIEVLRDGVVIATLPGTDVSYLDIAPGNGVHTYEVVGDCGVGLGTWSTSCSIIHCSAIANDTCLTATPAVQGPNPFDTTFALVDPAAPPFSCAAGGGPDAWFVFTPPCDATFTFDLGNSTYDTALELFDGGASPGDCAALTLISCDDDGGVGLTSRIEAPLIGTNTYFLRCSGFNNAVGVGEMEIGLAAVTGLAGIYDCTAQVVDLIWDGAGIGPTYDSYDVLRNGTAIATGLPAGTTSYQDASPPPGANTYAVVGTSTGCSGTSLEASITVTVPDATATDVIVRGELPSQIDSVAALDAALVALGKDTTIVDGAPADAPCDLLTGPNVERVWVLLGSFPDDITLTGTDEQVLVDAQALGKGLYLEGGDIWGFTPISATLAAIDGVEDGTAVDGDDTFLSMNGANSGFGLDTSDLVGVTYNQDQAGNDWTDRIQPATLDTLGPNAAVIWTEAAGTYNTGVYYDTNAGGKVISQTWEFGGFGGDQQDLAGRYVNALGGTIITGTEFDRGDCNADSTRNIADAVAALATLFPPAGSPPPTPACFDACDANDDGNFNIADAVSILAFLFPPGGGPPVVIPDPSGVCGLDPTDDPLDCLSFGPCP